MAFGLENLGVAREEMRARVHSHRGRRAYRLRAARAAHPLRRRSSASPSPGCWPWDPRSWSSTSRPRCSTPQDAARGSAGALRALRATRTILHVTHHLEELVDADRILVLNGGNLVAEVLPERLFSDEALAGEPTRPADRGAARAGPRPVADELRTPEDLAEAVKARTARGAGPNGARGSGTVRHVYAPGTPFGVRRCEGRRSSWSRRGARDEVGGTGSGKSTLVQHMNLLLTPTSGEVLVDGVDATTLKRASWRRRVGLVFQFPEAALFAPTVEDVAFAPRRLGLVEGEVQTRVQDTAGARGRASGGRSPFALSGGEKRRVAVARGAGGGRGIVLDEPTADTDPRRAGPARSDPEPQRGGYLRRAGLPRPGGGRRSGRCVCVVERGEVRTVGTPAEVFYGNADLAPATVQTVVALGDATASQEAGPIPEDPRGAPGVGGGTGLALTTRSLGQFYPVATTPLRSTPGRRSWLPGRARPRVVPGGLDSGFSSRRGRGGGARGGERYPGRRLPPGPAARGLYSGADGGVPGPVLAGGRRSSSGDGSRCIRLDCDWGCFWR